MLFFRTAYKNYMKIITILIGDPYGFPPVLSLLHAFEKLEVKSVFITTNSKKNIKKELPKTSVEQIKIDYEGVNSPVIKMILYFGLLQMSR